MANLCLMPHLRDVLALIPEGKGYRWSCRKISRNSGPLFGPQRSTQATTLQEIGNVFRDPLDGWPSREVTFPMGGSAICTFGNISSYTTFARTLYDPVTVSLGACGATKASTRDFRKLDGARELLSASK